VSVFDVAVIGGGLVGTTAAWELSRRGHSVALIDAAFEGKASTAAVGMLTPCCEWEEYEGAAWFRFLVDYRDYYRPFLGLLNVANDAFRSVGYRPSDFYMVDLKSRAEGLAAHADVLLELGADVRYLPAGHPEARRLALDLRSSRGVLHIKDEAFVNPRLLLRAVRRAFISSGGVAVPGLLLDVKRSETNFDFRLKMAMPLLSVFDFRGSVERRDRSPVWPEHRRVSRAGRDR
jgi:glycine/D-amino acid oxidase-like deaminating enzyme